MTELLRGRHRRLVAGAAAVLLGTGIGVAGATPAGAAPATGALPATTAAQIAALQQIKSSLTPAERKLDSSLAVASRERVDPGVTDRLPHLRSAVRTTGTTDVDISVTSVGKDLLTRLAGAGATVRYASTDLATVRAALPVAQLTTVAAWPDVRHVGVATGAFTARETPGGAATADRSDRPVTPAAKAAAGRRLDDRVRDALADQGTVVSEGDKAEAVDKARVRTGVQGVGVKVCVLSDGIDSLGASQAAGELPDVDVLPGQEGSGDEGTAMLEIVHDLAPHATLGFATAFLSEASFADNIRALRSVGRCSIIVDDVSYFDESPFQDGPVAQAVNAVTADGALYFSSAGNEGNTLDGTSGNYEGDFAGSGVPVGGAATGTAHDFDPGPGVQPYEPLSDASTGVPVTLFWADPLGAASDDYDLYLLDASGNVVSASQNVQTGTQDPYERLDTPFQGGLRLAVVKASGADRYFQLSAQRGRFSNSADGLRAYVTPGITRGHSAAVDAFSIAAAPAAQPLDFDLEPGDPPNPSGPFPNAFTTKQLPERFTSDGPRRVFFQADGTPTTPGNFTATGGAVRQKPDFTAADGVSTSVDGFDPFFGTSAAAPHAAAIAALVLSGNPGATGADVRAAYRATALDLAPRGVDARTGYGVLNANSVLRYSGATAQPLAGTGTPTVTPTTGDGDAYLERGESASVKVPEVNRGDGAAAGVSLVLTSTDPLVTVSPRSQSYGTVAAGASKSKVFTVKLAATYPLGKPVQLAARTTFAGILSPTTSTVTLATGQPGTATTFAYAGPPVAIPDATPAGASAPIVVSGVGYGSALTFSIDGSSCSAVAGATTVGIDHTYVSDLAATLTAPDGRTARLFTHSGGSGNNLCQVVFTDSAAAPFATVTSSNAPFTGSYRPVDALGSLLTDPVDGTWTLTVHDDLGGDTGSIRAVSLHVTGFTAG